MAEASKKHLPEHNDFYREGVFAVVAPDGKPVFESFETTGHGARASYLRIANRRWSVCEEQGFGVQEFAPVARVVRSDSPSENAEILPGIPTTREGWCLYDTPEAEEIALSLAREFSSLIREEALNIVALDDKYRDDAAARINRDMEKLMNLFRHSGAYDTEPRAVLQSLIRKAFRIE